MQSLILEAGMRPVLLGLAIGGLFIGVVGIAVFSIGAKLPYRKMLVVTGGLVIFVLFTFIGSTVRLFQTVGWLSGSSGLGPRIAGLDGSLARIVSDVGGIVDSLCNLRICRRHVAPRQI